MHTAPGATGCLNMTHPYYIHNQLRRLTPITVYAPRLRAGVDWFLASLLEGDSSSSSPASASRWSCSRCILTIMWSMMSSCPPPPSAASGGGASSSSSSAGGASSATSSSSASSSTSRSPEDGPSAMHTAVYVRVTGGPLHWRRDRFYVGRY